MSKTKGSGRRIKWGKELAIERQERRPCFEEHVRHMPIKELAMDWQEKRPRLCWTCRHIPIKTVVIVHKNWVVNVFVNVRILLAQCDSMYYWLQIQHRLLIFCITSQCIVLVFCFTSFCSQCGFFLDQWKWAVQWKWWLFYLFLFCRWLINNPFWRTRFSGYVKVKKSEAVVGHRAFKWCVWSPCLKISIIILFPKI